MCESGLGLHPCQLSFDRNLKLIIFLINRNMILNQSRCYAYFLSGYFVRLWVFTKQFLAPANRT